MVYESARLVWLDGRSVSIADAGSPWMRRPRSDAPASGVCSVVTIEEAP